MIIDSFAGGGGASTGIELALGRSPDVAINHSAAALALHAANHPETLHLDSNIWDVQPREVTRGRHVGLLWASPDCKHFSKAKGGAPRDRNIRDLAWVIVRWAEEVAPDVICMENVEEFVTWGPVDEEGRVVEWLRGDTFRDWLRRLRRAGYKVQWRELRACDYGAPTIRKRFFLIARRDGRPIIWPKPTHGDPKSTVVKRGKLLPWRTAAECIDWSLPCPSIFASAPEIMAEHGLRAVRPLAHNTMARMARGMQRYVLQASRPYLVNLTHGCREESAAEPFRTITGAHRGEKAAVVPTIVGCGGRAGQSRPRGGDEPFATITAKADACIATATIAPSIQRFNSGATGQDCRDPLATVTANSWIKRPGGAAPLGLLAPFLAELGHGETSATGARRWGFGSKPLTEQLGTITAGGKSHALIAPVLTYAQQGGGIRPAEAPHHTICASRKDQNSLIAASMVQIGYGERKGQAPRALDIGQPLGTAVAGGAKHAPFAAFLAQQNSDSRRAGGVNPGRRADEPLSTVTQTGSHQTPIAAFIARQFGTGASHALTEPCRTVMPDGQGKTQLVAPWFAKYYGTGDGVRTDDPCHTITVKDRFSHVQAALTAPPFAPEHEPRARQVAEFLRAHGAWEGGEFATLTINGAEFVVIDIGLRMLTPRELYRAQGFPDDYVIDGVWEERASDWHWRAFPKDVQVSCVGNSVCPPLAEALVRANCGHLVAKSQQEAAHG